MLFYKTLLIFNSCCLTYLNLFHLVVFLDVNFEEILNTYFAGVKSNKWLYMVQVDDTAIEYEMNATEFREFMEVWGRMGTESGSHKGKVRILATSMKMIKWLEDRVAC